MGSLSFTTTLVRRGPGTAIVLDDEQVAVIGEGAKRFRVRLLVNGEKLLASVARMGGENLLGLSRELRAQAGLEAGDTLEVTVTLDTEPREVELPEALASALAADPTAAAAFGALAYTHRREYARWVSEAKREETRQRRVAETLERVRSGRS